MWRENVSRLLLQGGDGEVSELQGPSSGESHQGLGLLRLALGIQTSYREPPLRSQVLFFLVNDVAVYA